VVTCTPAALCNTRIIQGRFLRFHVTSMALMDTYRYLHLSEMQLKGPSKVKIVPVYAMKGIWWSAGTAPHTRPRNYMKLSGQLYVPTALTPGPI
jgi:hypothetical protein